MKRERRSGFSQGTTLGLHALLCGVLAFGGIALPAAAQDSSTLIREASLLLAGREFIPAAELFASVLAEDESDTVAREGLGHALAGAGIEASRDEREGRVPEAVAVLRRSLALNLGGSERLDRLRVQAKGKLAALAPLVESDAPSEAEPVAEAAVAAVPVDRAPAQAAERDEPTGASAVGVAATAATVGAGRAAVGSATPIVTPRPRDEFSEYVVLPTARTAAPDGAAPEGRRASLPPAEEAEDDAVDHSPQWELLEYPQEDFDELLQNGKRLRQEGEYAASLEHFTVARSVREGDPDAIAGYRATIDAIASQARALVKAGKLDQAETLIDQARNAAPADPTLALAEDLVRSARRRQ